MGWIKFTKNGKQQGLYALFAPEIQITKQNGTTIEASYDIYKIYNSNTSTSTSIELPCFGSWTIKEKNGSQEIATRSVVVNTVKQYSIDMTQPEPTTTLCNVVATIRADGLQDVVIEQVEE